MWLLAGPQLMVLHEGVGFTADCFKPRVGLQAGLRLIVLVYKIVGDCFYTESRITIKLACS